MTLKMLTEADDKKLITITPEWMEQKFNEMNKLLFDGELKPCKLSLFTTGKGSRGSTLGWFKHSPLYFSKKGYGYKKPCYVKNYWGDKIWLDDDNFNQYANPEIQLNGNYNWTEKAALSTLVHEMCHYYDYKDGWAPVQAHGPSFRSIAARVSRKSNDFFTVERLARAEQMDQMEFTDNMKAFNSQRAAKGIRFYKIELAAPESTRRGVYKFAYAIPASTIAEKYGIYMRSCDPNRYKRIFECTTTDGNIKKYHTVNEVGRWFYSNAKTIEELLGDVVVDTETEIQLGETQQLQQPWYIFKMKYKTPYEMKGIYYPWAYLIVEPKNYFVVRNYVANEQYKFVYAECCSTNDPHIISHKPSNIKSMSINYLSRTEFILPNVEQNEPEVIFNNEKQQSQQQQSSLASFLYGNGGNPHLQYAQQQNQAPPEKRYNIVLSLKKNGVSNGTFTLQNATEQEIKQQMKQRFPGWSDEVINNMFNRYAQEQQSNIALQESDVRYVVERVVEQLKNGTT